MKKRFNIIRTSEDYGSPLKRRLCIDIEAGKEVRDYLFANQEKCNQIIERILTMPNMYYDHYKREYKSANGEQVSAIRFYDIENTRIYCQETRNSNGEFFVISAAVFSKKSEKNNKVNNPILKAISEHEYSHKP